MKYKNGIKEKQIPDRKALIKNFESPLRIRRRVRGIIEERPKNTGDLRGLIYAHSLKVTKIITYLAGN